MRRFILLLVAALVAFTVRPGLAQSSIHQRLTSIGVQMIYTMAQRHPMQATALGIKGHDGDLESPTQAMRDEDIRLLRSWKRQVREIAPPSASLSLVDRDDAKLLTAQIDGQLNSLLVYRFDRKDYSAPAQAVVGAIFTQFQHLPIAGRSGAGSADVTKAWNDIIQRLSKDSGVYSCGANARDQSGALARRHRQRATRRRVRLLQRRVDASRNLAAGPC